MLLMLFSPTVPANYNYLPDTSLLRAGMDLLTEGGKLGPERVSPDSVRVVLSAMIGESDAMPSLPPVNWAAVLAPLLRLPYGKIYVDRGRFAGTRACISR